MAKKETVIMQIARKNNTLSNDTCKKIIKNSPLVYKDMTIKEFKEAYHSNKTLPEYRAMLLASAFDKNVNFINSFKYLSPNKNVLRSNILHLSVMDANNGQKSFVLTTYDAAKHKGVIVPFNNKLREEVHRWQPKGEKNRLLTRALLSINVHSQKVAFVLGDLKTAIFAAADMLITNVKANDPLLEYLIDSDRPSIKELEEALEGEAGSYKRTQNRFLNDLKHMNNQFNNLFPILDKMGINTRDLQDQLQHLINDVNNFVNTDYDDRIQEIHGMYDSFTHINDTITEVQSIAAQIDMLDINDPEVYRLGRLEVMPTFTDYSYSKASSHRRAVDESVNQLVEDYINKTGFNRKKR